MLKRKLFPAVATAIALTASALIASILAVGLPVATASAHEAELRSHGTSRSYALKNKRRAHARARHKRKYYGVPNRVPLGAAYIYQDYPYYYRRGYYPTHFGRYIYDNPNDYGRSYLYGGRCSNRQRRCVAKKSGG